MSIPWMLVTAAPEYTPPTVRQISIYSLLLLTTCGGKATPPSAVDGHYSMERTCVATETVARTETVPGLLQESGRRYSYGLTVSSTSEHGKVKVSTDEGYRFVADMDESGVISAQNTDCEPLAVGSNLHAAGVEAVRMLLFSFDSQAGIAREHVMVDLSGTDSRRPNTPLKRYVVCEGYVATAARTARAFELRYDGTARDSVRQPESIQQAAAPGCTNLVGEGWTSGSLFVKFGENKNELIIYEVGVGCTVRAKSQDGVVFRADNTDCEFGDFGVNLLGVLTRHYSSYVIDLGAKTWSYASMDETKVNSIPQCLQAESQLSGELPR